MPGDGYIYYSSIIVKTDVITGLMNRQSYEGRIPYVSVGYSRFDPDKNDCESCVKERIYRCMSGSRGVKRSEKTVDFYFMLKIRKKLIKK